MTTIAREDILSACSFYDIHLQYLYYTISTKKENKQAENLSQPGVQKMRLPHNKTSFILYIRDLKYIVHTITTTDGDETFNVDILNIDPDDTLFRY